MIKQLYLININGREHQWGLPVMATKDDVADWRADGLSVDGPVCYTIPEEVVDCGSWAVKLWFLATDLFNFRNPWRKDKPPATKDFMRGE